jgi:hypothetical protein
MREEKQRIKKGFILGVMYNKLDPEDVFEQVPVELEGTPIFSATSW